MLASDQLLPPGIHAEAMQLNIQLRHEYHPRSAWVLPDWSEGALVNLLLQALLRQTLPLLDAIF